MCEKQIKALKEHGKQLVKFNSEKDYPLLLKQTQIFDELSNERIDEMKNLSKQIDVIDTLKTYFC